MAEAVMVPLMTNPFKGSAVEAHATDVFTRSADAHLIQWLKVLERIWATLLHVSSRALVYLTVASANPVPAAVAVCGFACVDGMAYYGLLEKWRFDQGATLARVHAYGGWRRHGAHGRIGVVRTFVRCRLTPACSRRRKARGEGEGCRHSTSRDKEQ